MSDEQSQDVETLELDNEVDTTEEEVAVDPTMSFVDALASGNFNDADTLFQDILGDKLQDTLDAEKIAVAGQIFNGEPDYEEDFTEDDVEYGEEAAEFGSADEVEVEETEEEVVETEE